jgi:hypothetical protein
MGFAFDLSAHPAVEPGCLSRPMADTEPDRACPFVDHSFSSCLTASIIQHFYEMDKEKLTWWVKAG